MVTIRVVRAPAPVPRWTIVTLLMPDSDWSTIPSLWRMIPIHPPPPRRAAEGTTGSGHGAPSPPSVILERPVTVVNDVLSGDRRAPSVVNDGQPGGGGLAVVDTAAPEMLTQRPNNSGGDPNPIHFPELPEVMGHRLRAWA